MRFRIRHVTTYRYQWPVTLGQHLFRLHPREDGKVSLDSFSLSLHPFPVNLPPSLDAEGNWIHSAQFEGETQEFRVSAQCEGWTHSLGAVPRSSEAMEPYLQRGSEAQTTLDFAGEDGGDAPSFLTLLNHRIHTHLRTVQRLTGVPMDPEQTLLEGKGSCRDLTVLFMACCRARGIAARFVSGYFPAPLGERQHMHAWAEAYLPDAGWRAYDPTLGGEADERHIAVAVAAEPASATPISGSYIGKARSEMEVEMSMEVF